MMAVPEFAGGGLVGGSSSGGIAAVVHPGEFVMTQAAVQRIGASVLQGMNTASAGVTAEPSNNVYIDPVDLTNAVRKALPVILRQGGPVSRALRV
jgi:hypothetical protein